MPTCEVTAESRRKDETTGWVWVYGYLPTPKLEGQR